MFTEKELKYINMLLNKEKNRLQNMKLCDTLTELPSNINENAINTTIELIDNITFKILIR